MKEAKVVIEEMVSMNRRLELARDMMCSFVFRHATDRHHICKVVCGEYFNKAYYQLDNKAYYQKMMRCAMWLTWLHNESVEAYVHAQNQTYDSDVARVQAEFLARLDSYRRRSSNFYRLPGELDGFPADPPSNPVEDKFEEFAKQRFADLASVFD